MPEKPNNWYCRVCGKPLLWEFDYDIRGIAIGHRDNGPRAMITLRALTDTTPEYYGLFRKWCEAVHSNETLANSTDMLAINVRTEISEDGERYYHLVLPE